MAKKVILIDNDEEELIPYTELATNNSAGRVRPDNSTVTVDGNGVLSVNVIATNSEFNTGTATDKTPSVKQVVDNLNTKATPANITSAINSMLSALYPVGSIYIGTQATCPLATLISGSTWVKVSEGRVLQGSDSGHDAGTTIEAGLPDITGNFTLTTAIQQSTGDGALFTYSNSGSVSGGLGGSSYNSNGIGQNNFVFNASRSNSIYGNSTTVQPPAYVVNIWRRTA